MNLVKKFLFILTLISSQNVNATHLLGGEIVWKCKTNGKYQFTLASKQETGLRKVIQENSSRLETVSIDREIQTNSNSTGSQP